MVPVVLVLLLACMLGVIYVRRTDAQQQKDKLAADQHIDGARSQGHANPMYSIPTDTGGSIQIPTLFLAGTDPNSTGTDSGKHTYNHLGDSTYGVASDVAIGPDLYDTVENKANDGENKGYLDVGESSASAEDGVAAARAEVLCFHPVEREECELKLNQAVLGGGSWFMTRAKAGATVLSYVIEKPEAARYVNIEGATERGVQHRKIVQNASDGSFETTQSGEQLSLGLTLPSAVSKLVEMLEIRFACKVNGLRVVQPVVAMPITMQDTYEAGEVGAAAVSATLPMEVAAGDELYYDGGKDKVRAGFTVDAAPGSAPAPPVAPSEAAPRKKSRPGPIAFGVEASIKPSPVTYVEATLDMPTTPAGGRDMEEVIERPRPFIHSFKGFLFCAHYHASLAFAGCPASFSLGLTTPFRSSPQNLPARAAWGRGGVARGIAVSIADVPCRLFYFVLLLLLLSVFFNSSSSSCPRSHR